MSCFPHPHGRFAPTMPATLAWPIPYMEDRFEELRRLVEQYRTAHFDASGAVTQAELAEALEGKADKVATLAGYGITDAYISNGSVTLGTVTAPLGASTFAELSGKPTTIDGYGITDAHIRDGVITLKASSIDTERFAMTRSALLVDDKWQLRLFAPGDDPGFGGSPAFTVELHLAATGRIDLVSPTVLDEDLAADEATRSRYADFNIGTEDAPQYEISRTFHYMRTWTAHVEGLTGGQAAFNGDYELVWDFWQIRYNREDDYLANKYDLAARWYNNGFEANRGIGFSGSYGPDSFNDATLTRTAWRYDIFTPVGHKSGTLWLCGACPWPVNSSGKFLPDFGLPTNVQNMLRDGRNYPDILLNARYFGDHYISGGGSVRGATGVYQPVFTIPGSNPSRQGTAYATESATASNSELVDLDTPVDYTGSQYNVYIDRHRSRWTLAKLMYSVEDGADGDALVSAGGEFVRPGTDASAGEEATPAVAEYAARSAFPAPGTSGTLYLAKDANKLYWWDPASSRYLAVAGEANIPDATESTGGLLTAAQAAKLAGIDSQANKYVLPVASAAALGGVRVGANLSIDSETGVLSATDTTYSLARASSGAGDPAVDGLVSGAEREKLRQASDIRSVGSGLSLDDTTHALSLDYTPPDATAEAKGVVRVGSGLAVSEGIISLNAPVADTVTKGVVQIGSGLSVNNGVVSYTLPSATGSAKGGVIVGDGLSVAADGRISVPDATQGTKGLMSAADKAKLDGIAAGANNYTLPAATADALGGVKVGAHLQISNGVLSAIYSAAEPSGDGTAGAPGLMSAADKRKLNGLADVRSVGDGLSLDGTTGALSLSGERPYALAAISTNEVGAGATAFAADVADRKITTLDLSAATSLSSVTLHLPSRTAEGQARDLLVRLKLAAGVSVAVSLTAGSPASAVTPEIGADTLLGLGGSAASTALVALTEIGDDAWMALAVQ